MQLTLTINGEELCVEVLERKGQALRFSLGNTEYHFTGKREANGALQLDQEIAPGVWRRVRGAVWHAKGMSHMQLGGHDFTVAEAAPGAAHSEQAPLSPRAPMPGLVRQVLVKKGERVVAGQALVVVEAMKLQLTLAAGGDGIVEAVLVTAGDMVRENAEAGAGESVKDPIHIVDVSARDGLQNEPGAAALSVADKVSFIEMLAACGLTRIEAGSFVKPSAVPAMANSAEVAVALQPLQAAHAGVTFSYLVPNIKGLERAREIGAKEIAVFLAVSEQFSKANINQDVDASFAAIAPVIRQAAAYGMKVRGYISTVFGYDDMAFSPQAVAGRAKQLLEMGCYEVSLGDTTGIGTPVMVEALVLALRAADIHLGQVAMHFHDTFGRAIGNVAMSYALGIRSFDAAAGGLGGCPYANSPKGNLRLEDLVAWCNAEKVPCEVHDERALAEASAFVLQRLGKTA